ncbi:hypothetical protein [Roseateles sp.]|uniref:hypothetical protein n=1 Tax=Roseateles sp. TaxID=1971397 RepID=UPI0031D69C7F
MEWVPTVFIIFKLGVLAIGMFYAIKWHYDKARQENGTEKQRAVLRAAGTVIVVFVVLLTLLLLLTFGLGSVLGIDLGFS